MTDNEDREIVRVNMSRSEYDSFDQTAKEEGLTFSEAFIKMIKNHLDNKDKESYVK